MTAAPAIVVENLGKTFYSPPGLGELFRGRLHGRPLEALAGVSFKVESGEIACIIGPNGAGKSTLIRVFGGLLLPSAGGGVAGIDAARYVEFRRRVAFIVGDERSFHYRVTGRGNLLYFAALHGLAGATARRKVDELLSRVGLSAAADRGYREYSRGMRQRLAVARGLLGDPDVLLLDEPTLGLDPLGARDLRAFLRDEIVRAAGRTAIVCSNDPTEARAMADRVLFLTGGRLSGEASPDRIEQELGLCEPRAQRRSCGRSGSCGCSAPSSAASCQRWAGTGRPSFSVCSASRWRSGRCFSCRASSEPPPTPTSRRTAATTWASP